MPQFPSTPLRNRNVATFEDLPVEILLAVVQDKVLEPDDLFNLARLSKTLNVLCLPLYFKAYGMTYPHFRIDIHGGNMNAALFIGRRVMAGLYAAVYLRPIPTLVFQLRFRQDSQVPYREVHFNRLCARLAGATQFVRAIHSLDDVVIIGDEEWLWNTGTGPLPDVMLLEWVTVMGDFMNALLEKGCTKLQVLRGNRIVDSYTFRRTLGTKLKHGVQSLVGSSATQDALDGLRGNGWEYRRPGKPGYTQNIIMKPSDAVLRTPGLVHFHIHSTQYTLPPHLSWTLGVLRSSPRLTSLSFANISLTETGEWDAVMGLIEQSVSTSLKELALPDFCNKEGEFESIVKFLRKLENLEHLELGMECDQLTLPATPSAPPHPVLLPCLRSLSAPVKTSNYLLSCRGWEHNRLVKTWRTFYKASYINYEPSPTHTFNSLFRNVSRGLLHQGKRRADETLEILVKINSHSDGYGSESDPLTALSGVNSLVFAPNLLMGVKKEPDDELGSFVSTVFPDVLQVESNITHPFLVDGLETGKAPQYLRLIVDWLATYLPSAQTLVLSSWVLSNLRNGSDHVIVTPRAEGSYQLWTG